MSPETPLYKHKSTLFQTSFTYLSCKLYNELPPGFSEYRIWNFKEKLKRLSLSENKFD